RFLGRGGLAHREAPGTKLTRDASRPSTPWLLDCPRACAKNRGQLEHMITKKLAPDLIPEPAPDLIRGLHSGLTRGWVPVFGKGLPPRKRGTITLSGMPTRREASRFRGACAPSPARHASPEVSNTAAFIASRAPVPAHTTNWNAW